MKNKKIIFFHPYSIIGGADLSISKLINCIPNDYDIDFITLSKKPKIKLYTKKKINILKIKNTRALFSIFKLRKYLKKEINAYKKIIFLSNQNYANIISILLCFGIKKIKQISFERNHISELEISKNLYLKIKNQIIKFLIKKLYKFSHLVISNSIELSRDLSKFASCKVRTLENFYDFNELKKKSRLKLEKKIKFSKNIILNVGRLTDQKNQILILKSFKFLLNKKPNMKLLIIGEGYKYSYLIDYIQKQKLQKNVQILKNIKNTLPYYKLSKLFLFSSEYEGFPNVLIESIFLKLPVISTDFKSGLKEILLNGKGGVILKKKEPNYISGQINYYLSNMKKLKSKMLNAKKNISKYNISVGRKKFLKILDTI